MPEENQPHDVYDDESNHWLIVEQHRRESRLSADHSADFIRYIVAKRKVKGDKDLAASQAVISRIESDYGRKI